MLEDLLTNMTFSPAMVGAIVAGLVLFSIGRASKGGVARKREEELKRDLLEAKASVPQLESTVRNRDQQISRLQEEVEDLNDRTTDLLRGQEEKGSALRKAERELKNLKSELNAVRGVRQDDNSIIMDGFDDEAPGDQKEVNQLRKLEKLYEKLKGALIDRDNRIEELEAQLAGKPDGDDLTPSILEDEPSSGQVHELEAKLADQQAAIDALQEEASELRKEKEMLENLASRRSKSNRALKDASAEMEARVPALEKQISERDETIQAREASIKRLLNETEEAKAEIVVRDEKIDNLKQEIVDKLSAVEAAELKQSELQTSLARREERITALDSELASTLENVQHLQAELRASDEKLTSQQSRIDEIDDELQRRDQAAQALQSTIKDRDFRIDSISNEKAELEKALENARSEAVAAARKVEEVKLEAEDTVALTEKRHQATESEKAATEQEVKSLKREIEDLKSTCQQNDTWMEKLKQKLEERETRSRDQQTRIEELQAELDQAGDSMRQRHDERQSMEDAKHQLETEIVTLKSKLEQSAAEMAEQAQTLTVYKSMLADKDFRIEALEQEAGQTPDAATEDGSTPSDVSNDEKEADDATASPAEDVASDEHSTSAEVETSPDQADSPAADETSSMDVASDGEPRNPQHAVS